MISWAHTFLIVVARTCAVTSRKAKEARTVPPGAGNFRGYLGEAGEGPAVMCKTIGHHHDAVGLALPRPDQLGARLDSPGQFQPAIRFCHCGLHELVEQAPCRGRKATIGLLLDPLRDAPPQQIRTERFWWFGPEQLAVSLPQICDWRRRQPIQLGLDRWIGRGRRLRSLPIRCHEAAPGLVTR